MEFHLLGLGLQTQTTFSQTILMATNLQVFKAPLPSTRPHLMGPANWRTWSKEMKMDLNNSNLYFTLHEHPADPRKLLPYELSASTQDWLQQTSTDRQTEITPLTNAEVESAYLALLRKEYSSFKRANALAVSKILTNCSPAIRQQIQHLDLASAIWAKLERIHQIATIGDVDGVLDELERLGQRSNTLTDNEIIDKVEAAKEDLETWGLPIPDVCYAIAMLRGLGRDYNKARRGVFALELGDLVWDEFVEGMRRDVAGEFN
ncbi:hypothetical protein GJ744_008209 [Endocarpon pusillum]|uniref:Uncharacterized protein n=1 Tax=Endocarpon pusillum TaxID=364733 RepID=A0A8H7AQH7_9EURO|nr:hypothetical protein GJ744_008209 [Endocarpon pusillum]